MCKTTKWGPNGVTMSVSGNVRTMWAWWVAAVVVTALMAQVTSLSGPNVCMVKQKYNITKRVKYRAPMSVRTYEWCFSMPPRCSRWNTEMRDLTRLETEERTAEMAVCCPGYKLRDVSCVLICPNGKTGHACSEECPRNKWGPNCVHECSECTRGSCSPATGECRCREGWQGESCNTSVSTTTTPASMMELLTTAKTTSTTKTTELTTPKPTTTPRVTTSVTRAKTQEPSSTIEITTTAREIDETTTSAKEVTIVTATETNTEERKTITNNNAASNKTDALETTNNNYETNPTEQNSLITKSTMTAVSIKPATIPITRTTSTTLVTIQPTTMNVKVTETIKLETSKKTESSFRYPTTVKFKPKEIWIRPAQKGESPVVDIKVKPNQELPHTKLKTATKKELIPENTTPKTIIVSIIPTSVSYVTFKKIALTTASYIAQKTNITVKSYNGTTNHGFTKPMTAQTTTAAPFTVKFINVKEASNVSTDSTPVNDTNTTHTLSIKNETLRTTVPTETTNSMLNEANKRLNSNFLTTVSISSTNATKIPRRHSTPSMENITTVRTTEGSINNATVIQRNVTNTNVTTTLEKKQDTNSKKLTNSNDKTNPVTESPADEETFHILTEPEHITAVMGDRGTERSSVDLISVISIAGGVMMAMITVAVVIVMLDRCKRPRYEDVRKFNDIRMQVMIDNNDVPPPYVRSIFHTPLPEPPTSEKCHYQPISTLDRNLKQFMRPVVVQTISPLMLENFRGILECHYDHLPRRSHDLENMHSRCSAAPSIDECEKLLHKRAHSITESTIDAMKCEATLDVIDNTTSEPLYAEIPCWRPPSEHAIEIVNLNGEAVTEL